MTTNKKRLHMLSIGVEGYIAAEHVVSRSLDGYLFYIGGDAYVKDEQSNEFWLHIRRLNIGTVDVLNNRSELAKHFGKGFYHEDGYPIAWIIM